MRSPELWLLFPALWYLADRVLLFSPVLHWWRCHPPWLRLAMCSLPSAQVARPPCPVVLLRVEGDSGVTAALTWGPCLGGKGLLW